ncbi:hypothetical protein [Cellulomonas soli]
MSAGFAITTGRLDGRGMRLSRSRRTWIAATGGLVVVAVTVAVVNGLGRGDAASTATCGRTASVPDDGSVEQVAQGAQLVVGAVTLGVGGDLSDDGCAVSVFGAVERLEVGVLTDVAGTPVMLLSVEPRNDPSDEPGGSFEATFWIGSQG